MVNPLESSRGIDPLAWQLAEYRAWLAADRTRRAYVFPASKHQRAMRDAVRVALPGAAVVALDDYVKPADGWKCDADHG